VVEDAASHNPIKRFIFEREFLRIHLEEVDAISEFRRLGFASGVV
jgi:hypothetical protein